VSATWGILEGDCREVLATLPAQSVHTVVTSPPYFGLRDYGTGQWEGGDESCDHLAPAAHGYDPKATSTLGPKRDGISAENSAHSDAVKRQQYGGECAKCGAMRIDRQIGLEPTPEEFVDALVEAFREVRRVLRNDGTVWLNLGDSYASGGRDWYDGSDRVNGRGRGHRSRPPTPAGCKAKDLLGIPWMAAFALRADGWYLRSDVIWSKPNPMPESVTDRPTKAHEYLFLLSKSPQYYYDAGAIRERDAGYASGNGFVGRQGGDRQTVIDGGAGSEERFTPGAGRNKRSVWTVATQPYAGAHFATFPPKLIEPCILAGAPERACGVCGAPWLRVVGKDCECGAMVPANAKECPECGHRNTAWAEGRVTDPALVVDGSGRTPGRAAPRKAGSMGHATTSSRGFTSSCDHDDDTATGVVLDLFAGTGTTGLVALRHGRSFVGIELSPEYAEMARERIRDDQPLFNSQSEVAA